MNEKLHLFAGCASGRGKPWKSRLLAQPPRTGFQAVIQSAASAASLGTKKISKKSKKNEKIVKKWWELSFCAFYNVLTNSYNAVWAGEQLG